MKLIPRPYRRPPGVAPPLRDTDEPQPLVATFARRYVIAFICFIFASYLVCLAGLPRLLLSRLGHGDNTVFIGREGWLFDDRDLLAITGLGPIAGDRPSAFHLPRLPGPPTAKAAILDFARQLKDRGVPLLLVIVPNKTMIYPERITGDLVEESPAPLYHPDEAEFVEQLGQAGIDVQDLTEGMMSMKTQPLKFKYPVFLPTDSHWTPETMQGFARSLAAHIRKQYPTAAAPTPLATSARVHDEHSHGDQVLSLRHSTTIFAPESVGLVTISGTDNDRDSPVTLLGDSLVNIFDDPTLGYAPAANAPRQGAGFAQHLAFYLGRRIDTIAINHGGATQVWREFAKRYEDEVRAKKLVVWLVSATDILRYPSTREPWETVPLSTTMKPAEVLTPLLNKPTP